MKALLLSNSTNYGEEYLSKGKDVIARFVGDRKRILFIPYAGVTVSYDDYTNKVSEVLTPFDIEVVGIHQFDNAREAVENADVIAVGGGNTFRLLEQLYVNELVDAIQQRVADGALYIGWSAGSNVAGETICTTNDMPIVEPLSFRSLGLIPYQINPHYTEATVANHGGESRKARLLEYIALNDSDVLCLPEGTWLEVSGDEIQYVGAENMTVYQHPDKVISMSQNDTKDYFKKD